MSKYKIFLSQPTITSEDWQFINSIQTQFSDNIANGLISNFENLLSQRLNNRSVVALNSGTSSLHLGLINSGLKRNDKVLVPTITFAASAFPLNYIGATAVFIDIDESNWNIDISLLEKYLKTCNSKNKPKAIISVDLFGSTCDYNELIRVCSEFDLMLIIDSAESLGTLYRGLPTTSFGKFSVLSFNNNKILTTTGGGALITDDFELAAKVRKNANQSRENFHWYEHTEVGYNFRLSPILAGLGISQLSRLDTSISHRRKIRLRYASNLNGYKGISVKTDSEWEISNAWLSTVRFSQKLYPGARDIVFKCLAENGIESRYVWKPLHQQPIYAKNDSILTGNANVIFNESLCLPSSEILREDQIDMICNLIINELRI